MPASKTSVYQETLRLFGDARLDTVLDDTESRYAMDDAWDGVVTFCLRAAPWRFALVTSTLSPVPDPLLIGFAFAFPKPIDWLRTHALFVLADNGVERPVDARERETHFYANRLGVNLRYIGSGFADPAEWTEHFAKAVAAYLAFQVADRLTNSAAAGQRMSQIFGTLMQEATLQDAVSEDPWLPFQLTGDFQRGLSYILTQGYWDFALKTIEFAAAPIATPLPTTPIIGYPYSFPVPVDMLRSHAFFVPAGDGREYPIEVREIGEQWSTAAPYLAIRYVSSIPGFNSDLWPEAFALTLLSYLRLAEAPDQPQQPPNRTGQLIPPAATFSNILAKALEINAQAENPWYRFLRNGSFIRACFHVAETGRWKFAINTLRLEADAWLEGDFVNGALPANVYGDGSISPSYSAVFAKPNDWLRTVWIYRIQSQTRPGVDLEGWPERHDIDYRDEGGNWHTNWRHIEVRYVRRAAVESWRWPQSYADAVLAWLEFDEARQDPKQTQIAVAKGAIYKDALERATKSDDMEERPPYRHVGHIVRGRFYRSRGVGAQDFLGPR